MEESKGLTTAASLWAVAGVGMAAGAGLYGVAVSGTVLMLVVLFLFDRIEHWARVRFGLPKRDANRGRHGERGEDMTLTTTNLEGLRLVHRGKVRETYEVDDRHLLLVATDRLSAFDVVFEQAIPDKGALLTRLSTWWFGELADLGRSHFVSADPSDLPEPARDPEMAGAIDARAPRRARRRRVRRPRLPRGLGLGGVPAQRIGDRPRAARPGCARPIACRSRSSRRRRRRRSATTRTSRGPSWPDMVGADLAEELERRSIALYVEAARRAEAVGLILADTKFEFGFIDGELAVIDEVLTPDSSRFWDGERYAPGQSPPSFDKQFVRDFVAASGWNREPPAPTLPDEVIEGTRDRYVAAYERLTGRTWE